jgi:ArsR family transcriptional regulator
MPTTEPDLRAVTKLFKALADETRVRIVALLGPGELCVCELQEVLDLPQPTVSRHLALLRAAGLVQDRREGNWVYYRLRALEDPRCAAHVELLTAGHRDFVAAGGVLAAAGGATRRRRNCP